MAWNSIYAATRYFRRRGDRVVRERALISLQSYPPRPATAAYARHATTLAGIGYHFALDVFIEDNQPPTRT